MAYLAVDYNSRRGGSFTKGMTMKAAQIKVGGHYTARVSGNLVTVRVDKIENRLNYNKTRQEVVYRVTNLRTRKQLTFHSAMKFRELACPHEDSSSMRDETFRNDTVGRVLTGVMAEPEVQAQIELEGYCICDVCGGKVRLETTKYGKGIGAICSGCQVEGAEYSSDPIARPADTDMGSMEVAESEGEQGSDPTAALASTLDEKASAAVSTVLQGESGSNTQPTMGFASRIATYRSSDEKQLTYEQQEILAVAPTVQVMVIEAGAGCGKTFELVELSRVLLGNGQYTAFNTSLVNESKTKFPRHVACNTIHSLAFRSEGIKFKHRLNGRRIQSSEVAAMLGLKAMTVDGPDGKPKVISAGLLAAQISRGLRNFCQSADQEVMLHHLPRLVGVDAENSKATSDFIRNYLLGYAQKMWEDKCNPDGCLPFVHDDYVKMWEMNDPVITSDYVLLDEAQDTSPVMLSVLEQQVKRGSRVIVVGDSAQQIYSWRGAVNALAAFPDAPRLILSQSFRFGQVVAEVANAVLSNLQDKTPLVMRGFEKIDSRLGDLPNPQAVLCRTNAGAISNLLEAIGRNKKACLIGKTDDILSFLRAAKDLQSNKRTEHPELCCFENWREVQAYAKTEDGEDLQLMVKLIDKFKPDRLIGALNSMPEEKDAELVISTAHKSKGREWKEVRLDNDFMPLTKMGDEELRLLYVAGTRAQHVLDVEHCPPFCGGKSEVDGSSYPTINLSKARRLSDEVQGKPLPEDKPVEEKAAEPQQPSDGVPTQVNGNTWQKGRGGDWLVRGKPGQSGLVEVKKKSGSVAKVTIKKTVWQNEEVALYEVTQ